MLRATTSILLAGLVLAGCVAPTATQRLTQSAYELNTAAQMGRMDIALELVRETVRDDFARTHADWGKSVRIVDYEIAGVSMRKDGDADVSVTVSWQRIDESTLRTTELAQRWTNKRGAWGMLTEKERAGDKGLFASLAPQASEPAAAPEPPPAPPRSRYQTRVIYEQ